MGVPGIDPLKAVGTYVDAARLERADLRPRCAGDRHAQQLRGRGGHLQGRRRPRHCRASASSRPLRRANSSRQQARKIAMFCTGGIRCEKATSFLRAQGFEKVYHLKGGILKYLETVPPEKSLWQGSCFVFDEREGLTHGLDIEKPTRLISRSSRGPPPHSSWSSAAASSASRPPRRWRVSFSSCTCQRLAWSTIGRTRSKRRCSPSKRSHSRFSPVSSRMVREVRWCSWRISAKRRSAEVRSVTSSAYCSATPMSAR